MRSMTEGLSIPQSKIGSEEPIFASPLYTRGPLGVPNNTPKKQKGGKP